MNCIQRKEQLLEDREEDVAYIEVDDNFVVRVTESYCEILENGHITQTMPFDKKIIEQKYNNQQGDS